LRCHRFPRILVVSEIQDDLKDTVHNRPVQKPHPPVYIGSWGSEAGLKRVAKYGDGWMASAYNITPEKFKERWKTVLSYRKLNGKDTESFQNSIMSMFGYIDGAGT
jgi:alkanesulfonate monooxygenase SsuD/methylene tetrahydromethanopterin reductase-like flavin-dependent oxidoreductase (luciferase family)